MTERSTPAAFLGAWRIETMELWAKSAIELLGPGIITFEDEALGEFRFIAGRGWALVENDGTLAGRLYFHQGDDSAFTATRTDSGQRAARKPKDRFRKQ